MKLLPVIELGYYNQGIESPIFKDEDSFIKDWNEFKVNCLKKAGMPNPISPVIPKSDFFSLQSFKGENLKWLVEQHVSDSIHKDYKGISPLFGGYALYEGKELLFTPQCCGDMSDIHWWKHICYKKEQVFYNGHPSPILTFSADTVSFDCKEEDFESFESIKKTFEIKILDLKNAYVNLLAEVNAFVREIEQLTFENYPISSKELAKVLVLQNEELEETSPQPITENG